jgi:hypothetical protein
MTSESAKQNVASENDPAIRNPFGVMDVPNPNDDDVTLYARNTVPEESAADENAKPWGAGDARIVGDRVYLLFDWDSGKRRGLIDARREGPRRLVGKYINLNNPEITVPWVGLAVSDQRIDGYFTQGRVDFRR